MFGLRRREAASGKAARPAFNWLIWNGYSCCAARRA